VEFFRPQDLHWIVPEMILTGLAFSILLLATVWPAQRRRMLGWLSLVAVVVTAGALLVTQSGVPSMPERPGGFPIMGDYPSFVADGFSLFFKIVILLSAALTILMSLRYLDTERSQAGEFYALVLLSVVGMMFMASGTDFAVLYIALELMSMSVYVLVGFIKHNRKSNEAALKYYILGAFSSGILLYGVSLVYGTCGTTNLIQIREAIAAGVEHQTMLLIGAILVTVGLAFKIAAVPFHMWTPDAYEGAPTAVTAFMATAVKTAAFALALRIFVEGFIGLRGDWVTLAALLAVASMTLGNVAAILQDNVKRMLAYSSIAHAGYALMGLVAIGAAAGGQKPRVDGLDGAQFGLVSVALYLLVYTFTTIGAFGLVVMLRRERVVGDRMEDFAGLARRAPVAAFAMLVFMLSLAGIPCTAGFIGKWWLFGAAVRADYAWLAVIAVVNSGVSLYYYVRLVVQMYMAPPADEEAYANSPGLTAALATCLGATLLIGVYPAPFIALARTALLAALP
jgi:NADH-quinone oxidoreductase subunit N